MSPEGAQSHPRGHTVLQALSVGGGVISGEPDLFPTFSYMHQTLHKETERAGLIPIMSRYISLFSSVL